MKPDRSIEAGGLGRQTLTFSKHGRQLIGQYSLPPVALLLYYGNPQIVRTLSFPITAP